MLVLSHPHDAMSPEPQTPSAIKFQVVDVVVMTQGSFCRLQPDLSSAQFAQLHCPQVEIRVDSTLFTHHF